MCRQKRPFGLKMPSIPHLPYPVTAASDDAEELLGVVGFGETFYGEGGSRVKAHENVPSRNAFAIGQGHPTFYRALDGLKSYYHTALDTSAPLP
jgi:hypothetical protein